MAVKKSGTGTHSTEVHIFSGASGFRQPILQTGTALHETDGFGATESVAPAEPRC